MHVAIDVQPSMFSVQIDGRGGGLTDVWSHWTKHDRLGVVVNEPWGALGASLMIQLAALRHYECAPDRRGPHAQYPQTQVFHLERMHGDHSSFDVWPPRHEVLVRGGPAALLGQLVDRGITRLLVPHGGRVDDAVFAAMPSGWSDRSALQDNVIEAYEYSASGELTPGGAGVVTLSSDAEELERMSAWALQPEQTYAQYSPLDDETLVRTMNIGPSTASDLRSWLGVLRTRITETPATLRAELSASRAASLTEGTRRQQFRAVDSVSALSRCWQ